MCIAVNDIVMLNSGGPLMRVLKICDDTVTVSWDNNKQTDAFSVPMLTLMYKAKHHLRLLK